MVWSGVGFDCNGLVDERHIEGGGRHQVGGRRELNGGLTWDEEKVDVGYECESTQRRYHRLHAEV